MEKEKQIQKESLNALSKYLEQVKDPLEQFSAYLHWGARIKYLIELQICWEFQGFKDKLSWDKIFDLSLELTKKNLKT
jgi:hypothetical protein